MPLDWLYNQKYDCGMDKFTYIKKAVTEMRWAQLKRVADTCELHINTLYAIRQGKTTNPAHQTVQRLFEAVEMELSRPPATRRRKTEPSVST